VYFSHRQLVLHTLGVPPRWAAPTARGTSTAKTCMPMTPMFHVHAWGFPYLATMLGVKQVYPGRYQPDVICRLISEERSASRIACRPSCTCC
jgi:fatty-acyl-CoA synthase